MNYLSKIIFIVVIITLVGCRKESIQDSDSDYWIDLGLPSGLLWASCNIGASSPEEYGNYYAWGEISTKNDYSWSTYAYGSAYNELTKYCCDSIYALNGLVDSLVTLQSSDDAANVTLDSGARMPNYNDWQELLKNTTCTFTTQNGATGVRFTASNGNSIFLPAAGLMSADGLSQCGAVCYYWTSSLYTGAPYHAMFFYFNYSISESRIGRANRYIGRSVRAVRSLP